MGGEVSDDYVIRSRTPALSAALLRVPSIAQLSEEEKANLVESFEGEVKDGLPPINEDSMPGELSNVIAGRIANAFDLSGANFTVDAACASSMAAIQTAAKGLLDGDFDLVLTGGSDRSMGIPRMTAQRLRSQPLCRHSGKFHGRGGQ